MIGIPTAEYVHRRKALMAQMAPGSVAILPAAPVYLRNGDVEHDYRQDSHFQYLTGFAEPEAFMVLIPGREQGEYILFCRDKNPERELWEGRRAGQEGACCDYGADEAFSIAQLDERLPGLIDGHGRLYYSLGLYPELDQQLPKWLNALRAKVRQGAQVPREFVDLSPLVHELRLRKSAAEIAVMRYAAELSAKAHVRAMQAARAGLYEYQLEAELDYVFRQGGAKRPAYGSIVGSGENACILHYRENDALLKDGDLVLIDAGCEIDCYASDITRSFPVNGRFSPEQQALYQLVLEANLQAIQQVAPGRRWNEPHDTTVRVITEGLVKLGLLEGEVSALIEAEAYKPFYMHKAGHWLGMDVHDVGDYKVEGQWRVLEPGMVLTIEPGIYIAPDNQNVPAPWRGIGIRIEDDVVVTADGHEVLTNSVPKHLADIELLMATARGQA